MSGKVWRSFYSLLSGYKKTYLILYLTKLTYILLSVIMPFVLSIFINEVLYHRNMSSVSPLVLLYCLLFCIFAIFSACDIIIWQYLSNYLVVSVKETLWKKFFALKMETFERYRYADIITIINEDSRVFVRLINQNIFPFVNAVTSTVICLAAVFYFNVLVGLFAAVAIPGILLINKSWTSRLQELAQKNRESSVKTTSHLLEVVSHLAEVKLLVAEKFFSGKLGNSIYEQLSTAKQLNLGNGKANAKINLLNALSKISIMLIVALAAFSGKINIGGYIAITIYISQIYDSLSVIFNFNFQFAQRKNNLSKIFSLLEEPEEDVEKGEELKVINGTVVFRDVSFSYSGEAELLKNVSFVAERGRILGITGPNGAGKSTILSLLTGLYQPSRGEIAIDGQPLKMLSLSSLRRSICINMQNELVDDMTIFEYIKSYHQNFTEDQVFAGLKDYRFCDFIHSKVDSVNKKLGDLSGGQVQRIRIASTLMSSTPILIFDEATSMLNTELEKEVFSYIVSAKASKTIIMIAHGEQYRQYFDTTVQLGEAKEGV